MDDLLTMLSFFLGAVFVLWIIIHKQVKQSQEQAAAVVAGWEQDPPQSRLVGDLGIAIATLESALLTMRAPLVESQPDPVLLTRNLPSAQSQLHDVQMQVEDQFADLPEADTILDALARIPSVAGGPAQGWLEAAGTMDQARTAIRETIAYLQDARARVRAEEDAAAAERALGSRLEAEELEAARVAGTLSAPAHLKERS